MDDTVGRLQSTLPAHRFDVIIGSLLGDARLERRSLGLRNPITARLRVHHGIKQKDYVFWKYKVLGDLVSREPQESNWRNLKRQRREISWYFHTRSLKELGDLHQCFYQKEVKVLPENIFRVLNPRMIAVWFMDDGSNNGKNLTINTHSFLYREQLRMVDFFRNRYGISPTIIKDRTKFKLAIGSGDYEKFIDIIRPFIIPAMSYKIVYPRNDLSQNQLGRSEATGSLSLC
jgi:hypothetical protein